MDIIEEWLVRIYIFFKGKLLICLLLEIIAPDIMFLSDIEKPVSREPSLLVCVGIEGDFGEGSDRDKRTGVVVQQRIEHIERQGPDSEIGESARTVQQKDAFHGMAFGIVQKYWSKRIFYPITFQEMLVLIIKQMNEIARDIDKKHTKPLKINLILNLNPSYIYI